MEYRSIAELVALAEREGCSLGTIALRAQAEADHLPEEALQERMREALGVMREADRKSTRLNSSHRHTSRMPSSA